MLTSALTQKTKIYIWIFKFCACVFSVSPIKILQEFWPKKADVLGIILQIPIGIP